MYDLIEYGHVLSKFNIKNYSLNTFDPFQFIDNSIFIFALPAFIINIHFINAIHKTRSGP